MNKMVFKIKIVFILFSIISANGFSQVYNNIGWENEKALVLYDSIISDIEYYDAEAIKTRNQAKKVSWKTYRDYHRKEFKKVKTLKDLREKFLALGSGFVNGHSQFEFVYKIEPDVEKENETSNIELGYTYPDFSFFDLTTKKTITKINGKNIHKIFNHFENYQTKENSTIDCQRAFKRRFEDGSLKIGKHKPNSLTFADGSKSDVIYSIENEQETLYEKFTKGLNIDAYKGWKKIALGYKASLLQKENIALIKVKDFLYFKGRGGDITCGEEAKDSTMCRDVQIIKSGLKKIKKQVDYLIIDLQDNFGGSENTPFIKMFCPGEFYDLRVQYKKTALLQNDSLRSFLNYNSDRAENWYQSIISNGVFKNTPDGEFLPARADFCQGDVNCELKPILPNDNITSKFKKIIVLVNEGTASSGDDFAYRLKEQKNVFIAGQPQSADLTYALVSVVYYLDNSNTIKKMFIGNSQRNYKVDGTALLKFDIPYSKTVDKDGIMLQGNPLKLDIKIPLTKQNFENRNLEVLNGAIKSLIFD